ncbi:hypothetical protein GQ457_07G036800 [Hibiscus cannabinus]
MREDPPEAAESPGFDQASVIPGNHFMERIVTEIRSSKWRRRFANSPVVTKWPTPGVGTNISSTFSILSLTASV